MKIPNENGIDGGQSSNSDSRPHTPTPSGDGDDGPNDFSEYMWMENQEEFDRQVLQELEDVVGTPTPPTNDPNDFSEFMWMENEEEFDKEVLRQLEEEALMKQCIESMFDDDDDLNIPSGRSGTNGASSGSSHRANQRNQSDFVRDFNNLRVQDTRERSDMVKKSTLNPDAAPFVPKVALESK
ncbi:polyA-Hypothetical protein protein interacting protein [Nesidiocoris tenuis]|uniref:Ataxin-2 C-terminal domain-containing protein n=1 Tax=Nesidiocoris tenuis TaxID=355587 RepID=A0ABN7BA70_9HEMI|nr:polyA-Hypothetical protein protein interacting protein [Nesidiocoris tenuis]